uniref:Uncharacterized protein n=1 Tax=Rhizophora mucronata TaxID=61149 RepID=A0A2P2JZ57_RHIMU
MYRSPKTCAKSDVPLGNFPNETWLKQLGIGPENELCERSNMLSSFN